MTVRIFDEERQSELHNLKLIVTVYPTEDEWISHWYFETNGDTEGETKSEDFRLQELYAILLSLGDVERGVERLYTFLHKEKYGDNNDDSK